MEKIEVSPVASDPNEIPEISFAEFLLERLKVHLPGIANKPWVVDVLTGRIVKYGEIDDQSCRIASALSRLGLHHGDILYFVTHDMAQVYVAMMAAWRLGAAVRGCYQLEEPDEYARQMLEGDVKIALIDVETAPRMREACSKLDWKVTFISLGSQFVEGATSFDDLLKDDISGMAVNVAVNPRSDVLIILNTSGSTGKPKGVLQTHYSAVALLSSTKLKYKATQTELTLSKNFTASNFLSAFSILNSGGTLLSIAKFERDNYIKEMLKHKPDSILMYPNMITWFVRDPEILKHDLSFIKSFHIAGSVLKYSTLGHLRTALPKITIHHLYAMSEISGISFTYFGITSPSDPIKTCRFEGITYVSTGKPLPYVKVKVVDPESDVILGRMKSGEILAQAPHLMKGHLVHISKPPNRCDIDDKGWFHTGDLGFFDEDGHLYIQERKSFMFRYCNEIISPSAIEAVVSEHPAVQDVVVVGVPNPETTCLARAMVILCPGVQATAAELEAHVSQRLPSHMHLHGGVTFLKLDKMPVVRGGKVNRAALLKIAIMAIGD